MGVMRWHIYEQAKEQYAHVHLTYGYLTKCTCMTHQLEKSHHVDARCFNGHPLARSDGTWYLVSDPIL